MAAAAKAMVIVGEAMKEGGGLEVEGLGGVDLV